MMIIIMAIYVCNVCMYVCMYVGRLRGLSERDPEVREPRARTVISHIMCIRCVHVYIYIYIYTYIHTY